MPTGTDLGSHTRGDTFIKTFTLGNSYLGAMFSAVKFTIRSQYASHTVTTDTVANGILAQGTVSGGEIVFDVSDDSMGTITFPASTTTGWVVGSYRWDLQGTVSGSPDQVYTIDSGSIKIVADVTRAP